MSSIVMPSGTTNAVMYRSMTTLASALVLARWAAPRPCTAPLATMPPYEWATTTTSLPSDTRPSSTPRKWAVSSASVLLGGSAPFEGWPTASEGRPWPSRSVRTSLKISGLRKAPGENTTVGGVLEQSTAAAGMMRAVRCDTVGGRIDGWEAILVLLAAQEDGWVGPL